MHDAEHEPCDGTSCFSIVYTIACIHEAIQRERSTSGWRSTFATPLARAARLLCGQLHARNEWHRDTDEHLSSRDTSVLSCVSSVPIEGAVLRSCFNVGLALKRPYEPLTKRETRGVNKGRNSESCTLRSSSIPGQMIFRVSASIIAMYSLDMKWATGPIAVISSSRSYRHSLSGFRMRPREESARFFDKCEPLPFQEMTETSLLGD